MAQSLKRKAINAIIWNAVQKYGALSIAFVTNIIMARLLSPDDFGLIGLLSVFIAVSTTISESGFSAALIQRKNVTQVDYCTVFYWNILISIILVTILHFTAPVIADYFGKPILSDMLRLQSIVLIINSFCAVQIARLSKMLKFKLLAIRTIAGTSVASLVGVLLAILGYGVWSLVWQGITNALISAILLWSVADWIPSREFSWKSFKEMFNFGSLIFISSISNTIYINIQSFLIGKFFSVKELGYYTQAKKLETIPVDGTSSVLNQVLFPVYSSIVDEKERMLKIIRKNIQLITFLTFPLMTMLIVIAHPLIIVLFGEKWEPSVDMFRILCLLGMFAPLNIANTEIFKSIGRSDVYLILQTIKRVINLIIILWMIQFGLYPMLWGIALTGIASYILNLIYTDRIIGYKYLLQLRDIVKNLFAALISMILNAVIFYLIINDNVWISLFAGVSIYIVIYLSISYFFNRKILIMLYDLIK